MLLPAEIRTHPVTSGPRVVSSSEGGQVPRATGSGVRQIPSPAQRANRRKFAVFLATFVLACVASLAYTFARPDEYRAAARV